MSALIKDVLLILPPDMGGRINKQHQIEYSL